MRLAALTCATLSLVACREFQEFQITQPSKVARLPPRPLNTPGRSHVPYTGKPKYLASTGPLLPTTGVVAADTNPCTQRSQTCDDRLRALLASLDGQILALTVPPTELQLSTLRLQLEQLAPLLAPYPDMASEGDELVAVVAKLPSMTTINQGSARRRMTELADLLRVQLAAAQ